MIFSVNYDGIFYEVDDSEETFEHVSTDPEFATRYIERILFNATENCSGSANGVQVDTDSDGVNCCAVIKKSESSWDHKSSLLFLEECLKRKSDLRNVKIRRRTVFLEVQKAMMLKGCNFSEHSLDKKLQNLKTRYNSILDNNNKKSTGRGRISWPYFDLMCQIYSDEVRVRDCPTFDSSSARDISFGNERSAGELDNQVIDSPQVMDDSPDSRFSTTSPLSSKRVQQKVAPKVRAKKTDIARKEVIDLEREKIALAQAHLDAMLRLVALKEKEMELLEKRINLDLELKNLKQKEIDLNEKKLSEL